MTTPEKQQQPLFTTSNKRSAVFQTDAMDRAVRIYPVLDSELETIAHFNNLMATGLSVGMGLLSFAIGLILDLVIEESPTDAAKKIVGILAVICVLLSVVAFGYAAWAWHKRKSTLDTIKEKSKATDTERSPMRGFQVTAGVSSTSSSSSTTRRPSST